MAFAFLTENEEDFSVNLTEMNDDDIIVVTSRKNYKTLDGLNDDDMQIFIPYTPDEVKEMRLNKNVSKITEKIMNKVISPAIIGMSIDDSYSSVVKQTVKETDESDPVSKSIPKKKRNTKKKDKAKS